VIEPLATAIGITLYKALQARTSQYATRLFLEAWRLLFSMEAQHKTGLRVEPGPIAWIDRPLAVQDEIQVEPPQFRACEEGDDPAES
jgi:hypothetical protein